MLVECMREGARRFGWENRPKIPASRREGNLLVGFGMAAAIRSNFLVPNQATVRLEADGTATVKTATTDIGTGTYTILAQIAAAEFGLPVSKVHVEIGDSDLPYSVGSGGSFGAASAGSSVLEACRALRQKLAEIAAADERSPLRGANSADASFRDGAMIMGGRQEALADLIARNAPNGVEAGGAIGPTPAMQSYSQHGYGAHFAEVTVDADTGEIRLRRMTSVFEAGRILNAKTARSQMLGGLIWGIGSALHEEAIVDTKLGLFANHDLASYHVPAHADVPELDVSFLDAYDDKANPLGIKGIGELGIAGAGAAIANAVFNATGIRVREYPITLDKLLDKLP
jgi:xanthine dehydrogenase YagR molybdenum-binding subunit